MQDLNDLYYFSIVVEKGGFAAAGRALDIPKSRLSRRIAQLEERLGVRLLQRSTRRFAVTDAGQRFYRHCQSVIAEAQAAEDAVAQLTTEPRGIVRISCPVSITQNVMTGILPEFCEKYPQVRILMLSTNRRVDLINEGIDIAIRVRFKLDTDADLVLRTFGRSSSFLVASPGYLREKGRPQHPQDLTNYDTISIAELENQSWEFSKDDGTTFRLDHSPRVMCGDFPLVLAAASRGLGVALLPESVCTRAVATGELEVVLPEWSPPEGIVHCVFPSRRGLLPAVRALIDWLAEKMPVAAQTQVPGI
ncbi:MAG: LysR family transcriptional regulator [Proteobacteria bacterium]|uniref:LysR substrate-binding domain-containing protein n=1 Tax=Rudaea sp. TaxID=2136325 RepID=UPI00321F8498|nr:LysR family transcriptional regulator [Pseudomonadota bacterium]